MPPKLNAEIINATIEGFESQKRRIDSQIAELRGMLDGNRPQPATTSEAAPRKRRKFSAAALKRMREAQQRRWAKVRGEAEPAQTAAPLPSKPKRKLSAAAKAKLVANLKKARAAKAAKTKAAAKQASPARKKTTAKKAAAKTAAPVKKAAVKKTAAKKTAPAAAQGATGTAGQ